MTAFQGLVLFQDVKRGPESLTDMNVCIKKGMCVSIAMPFICHIPALLLVDALINKLLSKL